jgi:hypothetical protein
MSAIGALSIASTGSLLLDVMGRRGANGETDPIAKGGRVSLFW